MVALFPLPKVNLIAAFLALFVAIHSRGNEKLSRDSRRYFSLCFSILFVAIGIECVYSYIPAEVSRHVVELFYLVVMCTDQIIPLLLYKACDIPAGRNFKLLAGIVIIHTAGELVLYPFDLVFYIDESNVFHYGVLEDFFLVFALLAIIIIGMIYLSLGHRFNHRKVQYLVASMTIMIMGFVADQYDATDGAAYLLQVWGLMLLYVYYSDLCTLQLVDTLMDNRRQMAYTLARAIDAKDKYTNGHSYRVAEYSAILAEGLGFSQEEVYRMRGLALLHDLGKIGVPDSVLNKPARLNDVEYEMIKAHTRMGGDIISHASPLAEAVAVCRNHHERYDGKGYPDGLAGQDIPLVARIVGVADAFDAMNSNRIYRKALPPEVIREEMAKGAGTQFDPDILAVFLKLYDEGKMVTEDEQQLADAHHGLTEFEEQIKDLFLAFEIKKEYKEDWDSEYGKLDQLHDYIDSLDNSEGVTYALAYVDITPKDEANVPRNLWDNAMETMSSVISAVTVGGSLCQRVSTHELAIVLVNEDADNPSNTMQNVLIYFYKIFPTSAFTITGGPVGGKNDKKA